MNTTIVFVAWEEYQGDETLISVCETKDRAEERIREWNNLYNRGRPLTQSEQVPQEEARWSAGRRAYSITSHVVAQA